MAAIDITGVGGGGISNVTGTSPVVVTIVGTARDVSLDQTQFKTINGNSIFGAGNIVVGLTNWTEAFNSGTQATSSFTATNAATNVNAALVPKGTGAIVAGVPNGAAIGGNSRGARAVDLQLARFVASHVASGANSGILFGANNTASSQYSTANGFGNVAQIGTGAAVLSGTANSCSGTNSVICGGDGSTESGTRNTIGGGKTQTIASTGGFVGGGELNTAAFYCVVVGGYGNTSNAAYASNLGGINNSATGNVSSVLGGEYGSAYLHGQKAHANGRFTITGDAQGSEAILRLVDGFTDAQTKEIYLDGSSLRITGPTNSAMTVNIDIVAIVTAISGTATGVTVGDMFSQNEICAYKNIAGTGTVVGSFSLHKLHDASMAACDTAFATTGAALQVFFTGPNFAGGGTVTLRVVAKARIVETRY